MRSLMSCDMKCVNVPRVNPFPPICYMTLRD